MVVLMVLLLLLCLQLLVPVWVSLKETKRALSGTVMRHLMLELAALLGKGTNALVHPLVTIDLVFLCAVAGKSRTLCKGSDSGRRLALHCAELGKVLSRG